LHICTEPEPEPDQYSIFNIVSLSGDAGEKSLNIIGGDKLRISGELENWRTGPHHMYLVKGLEEYCSHGV
jgi:hypothetical protein